MKKAKERLDAEATYQMTWRQRVENAWFYYKWHVIGSAFAIVLITLFVHDIVTNVSPDYQLAVMTPNYLSDEVTQKLEQALLPLVDDLNGDGKTLVTVVTYQMAVPGAQTASAPVVDPNMQMAATTRMAADAQMIESLLFITDYPAEYHQSTEMFLYNDGTEPAAGVAPDPDRLGVPLKDCPPLAEMLAGDGMERFQDYRLVRRAVAPTLLEKNKNDLARRVAAGDALFAKLTGK